MTHEQPDPTGEVFDRLTAQVAEVCPTAKSESQGGGLSEDTAARLRMLLVGDGGQRA